ncbi:hypothetical protein ACFSCX_23335 [Bacillus salitolerans]|uniref:Uncharacterized protein n=1 Tax=Bacillus salitolerans TaxID=1437434 RepID=A0ABW4LXZ4_9BACI
MSKVDESAVIVTYNDRNLLKALSNRHFTVQYMENLEKFITKETDNLVIHHEYLTLAKDEVNISRLHDGSYKVINSGFSDKVGTYTCEKIDVYSFGLMVNNCVVEGKVEYEHSLLPLQTSDLIKMMTLMKN